MADVVVDPENKNARNLLTQGIKAYVLQDYASAVQALGKASELMVADNGNELDDSLGEVYFYYGKALLASSRQESGPLGNVLPNKEEENDESEGEEEKDEEDENDVNEKKDDEVKKEVESEDDNDVKPDVSGNLAGIDENVAPETTKSNIKTEDTSVTEEPLEESDDPSDLQLAWEVMELAKKIFEERGADGKRHLAETLTTLGEISMESENFEAAIKDIEDGLAIQEEIFSKDSRKVAETCYNLGVAYSTNNSSEKAIKAFEKSLAYLNERISVLEKQGDGEEEIKEIKDLIPELNEKITETKNHQSETLKTLAELTNHPETANKIIEGATSSSSKQATDITHLVKRKRKSEDKEEDIKPPKKVSK